MAKLIINICFDVEGPLVEDIEATFERIAQLSGVKLSASPEALEQIQKKQHPDIPEALREFLAETFSPTRLYYASNWDELHTNMRKACDPSFRNQWQDVNGQGLVYNYYLTDFTGFELNPRQKCDTHHGIYDPYIEHYVSKEDGVYWHYHQVPESKNATIWSTNWASSDEYNRILSRKVLERNFFPSCFRAGGHIERNDLSYWLEQWIPFDFSNRSYPGEKPNASSAWHYAPDDWSHYHPCFYDYQKPGAMQRTIFRCLDIDSRIYQLEEEEVKKAFSRAENGSDTILSIYTHDYRDVPKEIRKAMDLIFAVSKTYSGVDLQFSNSLEAARQILNLNPQNLSFDMKLEAKTLTVRTQGEMYCLQPYLACKHVDGHYYHDNFVKIAENHFEYRFFESLPTEIGVAANTKSGDTFIQKLNLD